MKFIIANIDAPPTHPPTHRNVFKMVIKSSWVDVSDDFTYAVTYENNSIGLEYMEWDVIALRKFQNQNEIQRYNELKKSKRFTEKEKLLINSLLIVDLETMYPGYFDFTFTYVDERGVERAVKIVD